MNHVGETRLRWLGHLERMDETNLVKREERIPRHNEESKAEKKSCDGMVKENMQKRGFCINDAQDKDKWR